VSQLFAVVVYSTGIDGDPREGQRVHDHVFLARDPKVHLDRLAERHGPLNAFPPNLTGRILYSPDSWEPSEELKAMGYTYNCKARVVAHVTDQEEV
jgi:hypothetical protein